MPATRNPAATTSVDAVQAALQAIADPARARTSAGFFKAGPGQYGAGDTFWGITVPTLRTLARAHRELPLDGIATLLDSPVHEQRLVGLLILCRRYDVGDEEQQQACYDFYLDHLDGVNSWDLVDSSAPQIVGAHLLTRDRRVLYRLVKSTVLWERRVAIVATQALIRAGESADTFQLAELLLDDAQDLLHKATGWMLREVGQHVGEDELRRFLEKNAARMPRTALRYSIERLSDEERKRWLAIKPARQRR